MKSGLMFLTNAALRRFLTRFFAIVSPVDRLWRRAPRVLILTYHSVDHTDWKYSISPDAFRRQMEFLRKHYRVVPLFDIVRYVRGEIQLTDRSVAVTFDDGYQGVYQNAFPILSALKIPATVFVVTSLEQGSAESTHHLPMMTWEELREMQASRLVVIGSHTKSHPNLDLLPEEEMQREIQESKDAITKNLGLAPIFFSYPKGRFSEIVKQAVQAGGFMAAVSIKQGLVRPGDDLYRLKRIEVNRGISFEEFKARLTPAIDWLTFFWRKYHGFG